MRKLLTSITIILFLLFHSIIPVQSDEQMKGIDIVFVVDDSASMQFNDPDKLAGEAVRRFVDLLPVEGDSLGIVTYSYDPIETKHLTPISNQAVKDEFKKFSTEKINQNGRNTDTGTALLAGGQVLDASKDSDRKKAVILITDGENDFRNRERTDKESNARLDEFLNKNYPVYTIGVNPQSEAFKTYLTRIATETGGKVWFPQASDELNAIIKEVAAELGNVALANTDIVSVSKDKFTDVKQTVPEDVLEANIQIDHEEPIKVELFDVDNQAVDLASDSVVLYSEDKYTNLKLLSPKAGDWTLKVKSTTKTIQVKVDWIYNYDVEVDVSIPETLAVQEPFIAEVTLALKGEPFTEDQYQGIDAEIYAQKKGSDDEVERFPLRVEGGRLVGELVLENPATYQFYAQVRGNNLDKSSELIDRELMASKGKSTDKKVSNKKPALWKSPKIFIPVLLAILAGVAFFIKSRLGGKSHLAGILEIELVEAGQVKDSFSSHIGNLNKSKISLETLFKLANRTSFLNGDLEKQVYLEAGEQYGTITFSTGKKVAGLDIRGLQANTLTREREAILSVDNSNQIKIRIKK